MQSAVPFPPRCGDRRGGEHVIVGAAVLPTAPLLVPGVSPTLPPGVAKVVDCIDAAVKALPRCDLVIAVAAGDPAIHDSATVTLAGIGRLDIHTVFEVDNDAVQRLAAATGYGITHAALPLDLAVLALNLGGVAPLVAMTVPADAPFDDLAAVGAVVAQTFGNHDTRAVVVAAGDLSAGLTEKSPLHLVSGAIFFDEQAVAAVDGGRLGGLSRIGPEEAQRVGARAWAPLVVLHGVTAGAKLGMVVRHYSAPRGVGYLVASGG